MAGQARVLYDFEGQPGTSELSIGTGEILNVTSKDVGEGWWEGSNQRGVSGIFPAAYVEAIVQNYNAPPAMPPPPLPQIYVEENATPALQQQQSQYDDDWDDDWDDDVSEANQGSHPGNPAAGGRSNSDVGSALDVNMAGLKLGDGKGTVRKNLNRFSHFVKTGGEAYILGANKVTATDSDQINIIETSNGITWAPNPQPYSCVVASPKKESKLKGLKSFIAYQLTPSLNNIQVSRRYKHFDWLHERLVEKFCIIPIPPLPDKQISGRYEEQFIERRRLQLQSFVSRVCDHPILSRSDVWLHFLTCTDAKRWKTGKRKAEKDEVIGAAIFGVVQVPEKSLDPLQLDSQTEAFGRFVQSFDTAVRMMQSNFAEQVKRQQGPYKRDYQRIGQSFRTLGTAMELLETAPLTRALSHTADTYDQIALLCEDQPRLDFEPMGDLLHDYRGLLASFPDIIVVHKGALQKRRELERSASEGKTESSVVVRAQQRTDVVSYTLLAEMSYFHQQRVHDFNAAAKIFLQEQITYYQKIVDHLQSTLSQYKDV
uniref:Sorting nexin n=1 Tax=Daphnia galeata TaxID=27404 RepID=A0A8J2S797_9CRUS|nr:unnamed protein product [Daphnia galeata]